MKSRRGTLVTLALLLAASWPLAAKTVEEKAQDAQEARAKIDRMAQEKLDEVLTAKPKAADLFDQAYGYAVFDNTKLSLGLTGGAGGKGVAVERASGKRTYMKMKSGSLGLGLGAATYNVVLLFQDERTFRDFVEGRWAAAASAGAVAGTAGAAAGDAFVHGVAAYALSGKGLMARADVSGTKFSKNKKLNQD